MESDYGYKLGVITGLKSVALPSSHSSPPPRSPLSLSLCLSLSLYFESVFLFLGRSGGRGGDVSSIEARVKKIVLPPHHHHR